MQPSCYQFNLQVFEKIGSNPSRGFNLEGLTESGWGTLRVTTINKEVMVAKTLAEYLSIDKEKRPSPLIISEPMKTKSHKLYLHPFGVYLCGGENNFEIYRALDPEETRTIAKNLLEILPQYHPDII